MPLESDDNWTFVRGQLERFDGHLPEETVAALRDRSSRGDAQATVILGYLHEDGRTLPKDFEAAFGCYKLAAEQGSSQGAYNVGTMLSQPEKYGPLGSKMTDAERRREAIDWWHRAYAGGDMYAAICLGEANEQGAGVDRDPQRALALYQLAHQSGNVEGTIRLAHCYCHGIGVRSDRDEYVRLLKIACDGGHPRACYELGYLYYESKVPCESPKLTGLEYCEKAAKLGHADAQEYCGEILAMGDKLGMPRDLPRGVSYLQSAIQAGSARAKFVMAILAAEGDGVPRDLEAARRLAKEAAQGGVAAAQPLLDFLHRNA